MKRDYAHSTVRGLGKALLATVVALSLLLLAAVSVLADTVRISDQAGVLNASQVRSVGSSLGYPVDIYTTSNFSGTKQSFNQHTAGRIDNARKIVIAVDTTNHYLAIAGGRSVPLTNSQYSDAVNAFRGSYAGSDYTGATIAALRSLQSSLAASGGNNGAGVTPAPAGGGIFSNFATSTLCCIGLIVLALIALFAFVRRRASRGLFGGFGRQGNAYNQPYNQPYNLGGYPPNYYGPGQGQGGMNPWAAGGLGAAAGGLLGYELGKNQGEREGGNQGQGDFGGGAGGNFGGDQGGGFGGGDFGGGAGGGFGGDQGGGFGGGDFGGGSGGDFGGGGGGGSGSDF
ncbi:MAG TPA: hypothetical protein VKY19_25235 [Ktedonosporobacter sp.]|nr:hypothetical protein [Ktedonosporobacter sp.]